MKEHLLEPVYFVNDGETQWLYVITHAEAKHKITRLKLHNVGQQDVEQPSWSCQLKVFRSTLVAEISPQVTLLNGLIVTRDPWRPQVKIVEPGLVHKLTDWISLVNG